MRTSLLFAVALAAFDYSSYQKQYGASSGASSGGNSSGSKSAGNAGYDWQKYAGAQGNSSKYSSGAGGFDWQKYWNGSESSGMNQNQSNTYDGPFKSEESILKLKGNVTALKAKQKEVEHALAQTKKYVPKNYQDAPVGQMKKDISDIKHLLKEAEEAKANETKNETKSEPSGAENLTQGTALLGQTELFTVIDAKVDDIEDKIKAVKKREEEIKKYVPKAYQGSALNSSKMELKTLEAELKAAKIEAAQKEAKDAAKALKIEAKKAGKEAKEVKKEEIEKEKKMEAKAKAEATKAKETSKAEEEKAKEKSSNETHPSAAANATAGFLALADAAGAATPAAAGFGGAATLGGLCAAVSVVSLFVVLRRRPVQIDQQPLLG